MHAAILLLALPHAFQDDPAALAQRLAALEARVVALEAAQEAAAEGAPTIERARERWQEAAALLEQTRADLTAFRRQHDLIDPERERTALVEADLDLERRALEVELEELRLAARARTIEEALARQPEHLEEVTPAELAVNPVRAQLHAQMLEVEREIDRLELDVTGGQAVRRRLEGILVGQLGALRQRYDAEPETVVAIPEARRLVPNPERLERLRELERVQAERAGQRELGRRLDDLRARHQQRLDKLLGLQGELEHLERARADAERRYEHALDALLEAEG